MRSAPEVSDGLRLRGLHNSYNRLRRILLLWVSRYRRSGDRTASQSAQGSARLFVFIPQLAHLHRHGAVPRRRRRRAVPFHLDGLLAGASCCTGSRSASASAWAITGCTRTGLQDVEGARVLPRRLRHADARGRARSSGSPRTASTISTPTTTAIRTRRATAASGRTWAGSSSAKPPQQHRADVALRARPRDAIRSTAG